MRRQPQDNGSSEWMNEWGIYIALYCVWLYTQSALQSCGVGVSPQPPPVCSIHLDDATEATGQRRQCAHHTPATGGEEREIEPIKWMGITRRPWLTRASGGNLARTPGLHPYSFTRSAMGFLMTTESQCTIPSLWLLLCRVSEWIRQFKIWSDWCWNNPMSQIPQRGSG